MTTTAKERVVELEAKVQELEAQLDAARDTVRRMLPLFGLEEADGDE